jgi:hypothetical protein
MEKFIDYGLENMAQTYESSDIYDNIISHRETIGYHALSFAVKASQLGDEFLLGKALDLARNYTSLNGMSMPNMLPAELYANITLEDFTKRKCLYDKHKRIDQWKTMGTKKKGINNSHLIN